MHRALDTTGAVLGPLAAFAILLAVPDDYRSVFVVSFAAEQLRIGSAQSILDARGIPSAQAVAELPEAEQRSVVLAIVRRELGVMTLAALVCAALVVRAAFLAPTL